MEMKSDAELLGAYAHARTEEAFEALVRRHIDLVHSVAARLVGGDAHLAQDVAQTVFVDLAKKSVALADRAELTGWLYTSTHHAAAKFVRSERRRREREEKSQLMRDLHSTDSADEAWSLIRPLIDHAMIELEDQDREAVVLRFYAGRTFVEVGAALRVSEDLARKRVDRALDKLHGLLARRGIRSTSSALALALSQHAVVATPATVVARIVTLSLAAPLVPWLSGLFSLMSTSKIIVGSASVVIAVVAGLLVARSSDSVSVNQETAPVPATGITAAPRATTSQSEESPVSFADEQANRAAFDSRQVEIRAILGEAYRTKQALTSYVIVSEREDAQRKRKTVMVEKVLRTQNGELSRVEQTTYDSVSGEFRSGEVRLKNADGRWLLVGDTAILEAWNRSTTDVTVVADRVAEIEGEKALEEPERRLIYDLREARWLDWDCIVIGETRTPELYRRFLENAQRIRDVSAITRPMDKGSSGYVPPSPESMFPLRTEKWIDARTNFIVRTLQFNPAGEVILDRSAVRYEMNGMLDEAEFSPAPDAKRMIAKSLSESTKARTEAARDQRSRAGTTGK